MEQFSFVFTIFFMLLGPVKLIPAFAAVTRGQDEAFARSTAVRATLVASAIVAFLVLAGGKLVGNYHISIDALRIGGGLVLLIAALQTIFPRPQAEAKSEQASPAPLQLAIAPLATPIIIPPAGVAAVLIFTMLAAEYPGMLQAVAIALAIIMVLNFIVMYFNRAIMKIPGLLMVLQVLGAVLIFMQVALSVETMLAALRHMGAIPQ
ncbi:MAG: MarC family protein [Hyphomicrobiaceae bacterium]